MDNNSERIDAFNQEIGSMKLRGANASGERILVILGALALAVGFALAILGGIQTSGTTNQADQRAFMATGSFLGIALVVVGAALFVRFSLARYLRFWLVRLVHESRSNTDRIVDAIRETTGSAPPQ